jgi:hypothetical protein
LNAAASRRKGLRVERELQETETGYLLSLPTTDGMIRAAFEHVEQARSHEINADVTLWQEIPGVTIEPFSARLNILSLSSRESYRRHLDDAYGKGGWTTILNRACGMVRAAWQNRPQSIAIDDAPERTYDTYRVEPFLVSHGPTVWFGDGGAGKTTVALSVSRQLGRVLYIDYEWDPAEVKDRLQMMGGGNGLRYMSGGGVPLADQLPGLRREIAAHGIEYLIVDSAGLACGGEPEKAEMAIRYFNALKALGIPSLTIAHVTKSGEDQRPFGSAFWHFAPRLTWNVKGNDETEDELRIGFFCRKSNVAKRPKPFGIRVGFFDQKIDIEIRELWPEFSEYLPLRQRVRQHLLSRGKSEVKNIAQELDAKHDSVYRVLRKMPDAMVSGKEWMIIHGGKSDRVGEIVTPNSDKGIRE